MTTTELLIQETKRRIFGESVPRIRKCLDLLTEDQVWDRPNPELSSIGNLVLHLCGNVTQWVNSSMGELPDNRVREDEFNADSRISKQELSSLLTKLEAETSATLDLLDDAALKRIYAVQGYQESGTSILVHVIEHFSYHTGQISWHTKLLTQTDLGYYAGQDLNKTE